MKVAARCPASCGELMQGWIEGSEKLISYPISWYSEVVLEEMKESTYIYNARCSKVWKAFDATCDYYHIAPSSLPPIALRVISTIPIAKGMASSTADIAATIKATAYYLGQDITPQEMAKICLLLEPTDSTIFPSLTLFDHIRGEVIEESFWVPQFDVLVLEPLELLITEHYRKSKGVSPYADQALELEEAVVLYRQAVKEQSLAKLGHVATISATLNQQLLEKPKFNALLEIVDTSELLGINVAHSGTVIGIMYEESKVSKQELISRLAEKQIFHDYPRYHFHQSVQGGVSIVIS